MASVLKTKESEERVGPSGLTGFNLDDFASNSRQLLERAQSEAQRLIAAAHEEASAIHKQAAQEGRATGLAEARKTVNEEIQQRVQSELQERLAVLEQTTGELAKQQSEWLEQFAESLTELSIGVAEKIVQHRLEDEREIVVRWAEQALRHARSARSLIVAVHPETLVQLGQQLETLLQAAGMPEDTRIEPDETLEPAGVVIRQPGGSIDAQLSSQLASLQRLLS